MTILVRFLKIQITFVDLHLKILICNCNDVIYIKECHTVSIIQKLIQFFYPEFMESVIIYYLSVLSQENNSHIMLMHMISTKGLLIIQHGWYQGIPRVFICRWPGLHLHYQNSCQQIILGY